MTRSCRTIQEEFARGDSALAAVAAPESLGEVLSSTKQQLQTSVSGTEVRAAATADLNWSSELVKTTASFATKGA
jgi:hypothetical protein